MRTLVILNIPQTTRPDNLQRILGGYGKIVQLEMPVVDLNQYNKINKALIKSESNKNVKNELEAMKLIENTTILALKRKNIKNLFKTISSNLNENSEESSNELIKATSQLTEILRQQADSLKKEPKQLNAATVILSEFENMIKSKGITKEIIEKVNKSITNFINIKDSEIGQCLKNLPTKEQLIDSSKIIVKDGKT